MWNTTIQDGAIEPGQHPRAGFRAHRFANAPRLVGSVMKMPC